MLLLPLLDCLHDKNENKDKKKNIASSSEKIASTKQATAAEAPRSSQRSEVGIVVRS